MARLSCKYFHVLAIKTDGTVAFAGDTSYGQGDVSGWTDIISVATGHRHSVGLKSDGTVVACGSNADGQCNVSSWSDIVSIDAGKFFTIGVNSEGKAFVCGTFTDGFAVSPLSNLDGSSQVFCSNESAVGLNSDGTVAGYCYKQDGTAYNNVASWSDVVTMSVGWRRAVGVRADGTIALSGEMTSGADVMQGWKKIFSVAVKREIYSGSHPGGTFGLSLCGRVLCAGDFHHDPEPEISTWENVCDIDCSLYYVIGLKSDGTALFHGVEWHGIRDEIARWSDLSPTPVNFIKCAPTKSNNGTVGAMYFPTAEAKRRTGADVLGAMYFPTAEGRAFVSSDIFGAGKYANKRGFHSVEIRELAIVDNAGLRLPVLSADVQISGDAGVSTIFVVPFNMGKSWLPAAQPPFRVVDSMGLPLFMFDSLDWSEYRGAHRTSLVIRTASLESIRVPVRVSLPAPLSVSASGAKMVTIVGAWDVAAGDIANCGGIVSTVVRAAHIHFDRDLPRTIIYG